MDGTSMMRVAEGWVVLSAIASVVLARWLGRGAGPVPVRTRADEAIEELEAIAS
jgi:hypothetical protein